MIELLTSQKARTGEKGEFVFVNSFGEPYKRDGIRKTLETALRRAGINNFRFHDLRHTFATRAIEKGWSSELVGEILGHQDIKTTKRYSHPGKSLREVVELLYHEEDNEE